MPRSPPNKKRRSKQKPQQPEEVRNTDNYDRISQLPDVLLCFITTFLSFKDAVVTSALSMRWRNIWNSRTVWYLNYDDFPRMRNKRENFEAFVDRVIFLHDGPGIQCLILSYLQYTGARSRINSWVEYLVRNKIHALQLDVYKSITPPLCLFNSTTLTELILRLYDAALNFPSVVSLGRMRGLRLERAKFTEHDSIEKLIAGSPVLEYLHLKDCNCHAFTFRSLKISSSVLKVLKLDDCGGLDVARIEMLTPNLTCFRFKGYGFVEGNHDLLNLSSILKVALDLKNFPNLYLHKKCHRITEHYGLHVTRALKLFHHLEYLLLSDWCIEYLSTLPDWLESLPSLFPDISRMDVSIWPNINHVYILILLIRRCPKLKALTVKIAQEVRQHTLNTNRETYPEPPDILSKEMFHDHLKKVEIRNFQGSHDELVLFKFIMKNSSVLETIKVIPAAETVPQSRAETVQAMVSCPKASSRVTIVFSLVTDHPI